MRHCRLTTYTQTETIVTVSRHVKLSSIPPPYITPSPAWCEILSEHAKNCRHIRLEYRMGSEKERSSCRAWTVSGTEDDEDDEAEYRVYSEMVEEFSGKVTDLSKALCMVIDAESRKLRIGPSDSPRIPQRVMWSLCLLGDGHRTLDERTINWKFRPMPEPTEDEEIEGEGVIVAPSRNMEDIQYAYITRLESRIRELEEMCNGYVNLHTAALGSLTEQSIKLMESHTENAVHLSNGVMATASETFDLMRARIEVDLLRAQLEVQGEGGDDFLDGPMGQVVMGHLPDILKQAPDLIMAFAEWLMAAAKSRGAPA